MGGWPPPYGIVLYIGTHPVGRGDGRGWGGEPPTGEGVAQGGGRPPGGGAWGRMLIKVPYKVPTITDIDEKPAFLSGSERELVTFPPL